MAGRDRNVFEEDSAAHYLMNWNAIHFPERLVSETKHSLFINRSTQWMFMEMIEDLESLLKRVWMV